MIRWPDVRQRHSYDCGDAVYRGCCVLLGIEPTQINVADVHLGVSPDVLEIELKRRGLHTISGEMELIDLHHHTQLGRAVCCLVRFGSVGHWVGVRGVSRHGRGPVWYHDPLTGPACANVRDWKSAWRDEHRSGSEYRNFALVAWV